MLHSNTAFLTKRELKQLNMPTSVCTLSPGDHVWLAARSRSPALKVTGWNASGAEAERSLEKEKKVWNLNKCICPVLYF